MGVEIVTEVVGVVYTEPEDIADGEVEGARIDDPFHGLLVASIN
jgi:hypothetical protein